MIFALIANFFVIYVLVWWIDRSFKTALLHPFLLGTLGAKIIGGIALGLVYIYYYHGGDTWNYFEEAHKIITYSREHPWGMWQLFWGNVIKPTGAQDFQFIGQPRAFLFSKIVAVFFLTTGGNYWLIGIYFSLISAVACFYLAEKLLSFFPVHRLAIVLSCLFFPSFVFWSSGLSKESLSVAALCFLTAETLAYLRTGKMPKISRAVLILLAIILLWKLKYFYAALLFPVLFSLLNMRWIFKDNWKNLSTGRSVGWFTGLFILPVLVVSQLHYNLHPQHIIDVAFKNYEIGIDHSAAGKALHFEGLKGTVWSFCTHFPEAAFDGLFRPNIWDWKNGLQIFAVIENFLMLLLSCLSLAVWLRTRPKIKLFYWAGLVYIVVLAGFLAFSSPNFGTLSRYRVGFEPFFVLMVLAINPMIQWLQKKLFLSSK